VGELLVGLQPRSSSWSSLIEFGRASGNLGDRDGRVDLIGSENLAYKRSARGVKIGNEKRYF